MEVGNFKSIVTLTIFLLANLIVVIPFTFRCNLPPTLIRPIEVALTKMHIIPQRGFSNASELHHEASKSLKLAIPIDFSTVPFVAAIFLVAVGAINVRDIRDSILGSDGVHPIDIMALFISLAYISISLDSTGLLRFLAFWVLRNGSSKGRLLYLLLYILFFSLGVIVGNDPVILSGTAFLAYMTRVAGIDDPTAWIYAQFAIVNIASAVLVSSNPTNLVLAGAFNLSFIIYTANVIVPVLLTAVLLFPCLLALFLLFPGHSARNGDQRSRRHTSLIPKFISINMSTNDASIPTADRLRVDTNNDLRMLLVDPQGAIFGLVILGVTLVALLATSAAHVGVGVYAITVPAAVIMFVRDVLHDWRLSNTPQVKGKTPEMVNSIRTAERNRSKDERSVEMDTLDHVRTGDAEASAKINLPKDPVGTQPSSSVHPTVLSQVTSNGQEVLNDVVPKINPSDSTDGPPSSNGLDVVRGQEPISYPPSSIALGTGDSSHNRSRLGSRAGSNPNLSPPSKDNSQQKSNDTLIGLLRSMTSRLSREFPTVLSTINRLPLSLIPFAFSMFILVQGLASNGWVEVFVGWWESWIRKTGTIGAVGGMGFIGVIACNVAGTNIGATILLTRVLQQWNSIYSPSIRTRDAAIYALALSSNYGAFSLSFSASLAGLLWRSILAQKHIHLKQRDFARTNLPIVACAMVIGCSILLAQMYIIKKD